MKKLLNLSTYKPHLDLVGPDWGLARELLADYAFQGLEVYPVPGHDMDRIPSELALGLHLRFFVFLNAICSSDSKTLEQTFGDLDTARHYYGGLEYEDLLSVYQEQLAWGKRAKVEYAVFHASQADLDHLVDWRFPWTWQVTIDLSALITNTLVKRTQPDYPILFENLWWPGGLRLDHPAEVERLFEKLDFNNAGLVLDTGHVLNKNQELTDESQAIDYLLQTVKNLGELKKTIKAVHLTKSLSGEYVRRVRKRGVDLAGDFWQKLGKAHIHVSEIDQHDAFAHPGICRLFDLIEPEFVVFEFSFTDESTWRGKIETQLKALDRINQ
ncbi:TIM barrel protein [Dethiosulfatarculus sandiegensis]|uniref:Xylose isomerase n=1 Tax=Dethiosulfatarculus sandiegensis TaxID=1429043 RepID=A0A0D2GDY0_9BACT|nr:TIM barrel protein [Dethiosulfatarculus sandiegensis]KIX13197.1 xylose isomerase [Dethiosulfatarculus sandiegensis]